MKEYTIAHEINGGEYMVIDLIKSPRAVKQISDKAIKTNGVTITFPEDIFEIEELK